MKRLNNKNQKAIITKLEINDTIYECEVIKKTIKHSYMRLKEDNKVLITVNKSLDDDAVNNFIRESLPKLINRKTNLKIVTPYYLFGVKQNRSYFVKNYNLRNDDSNINDIYIKITEDKINELLPKVNERIKILNLEPLPIKVKVLKSKYGSIHLVKKYITINATLALLEPNYLLSVIYHEYAHLIEANHSKIFYNTVIKLMPDYMEYHKKIRTKKLILG